MELGLQFIALATPMMNRQQVSIESLQLVSLLLQVKLALPVPMRSRGLRALTYYYYHHHAQLFTDSLAISLHRRMVCPHTSRKHGKKEPQSFSHCIFFYQHDLQSLNECKFVF
jgi:hypothetical protein